MKKNNVGSILLLVLAFLVAPLLADDVEAINPARVAVNHGPNDAHFALHALVLSRDITWLSTDTGSLRADINSLAIDTGSLRADINSLAIDTGSLRVDINSLAIDTGSLAADIASLSIDTGSLALDTGSLASDIASLSIDTGSLDRFDLTSIEFIILNATNAPAQSDNLIAVANSLRSGLRNVS